MRTLKMPICGNAYVAEAIACYENGNHATIYTVDPTAEESDANQTRGRVARTEANV